MNHYKDRAGVSGLPNAVINRKPRNARFWYFHPRTSEHIKLTLRPGQVIELSGGGPCDEGWNRWSERLEHDGERILYSWATDGVDCDGRVSNSRDLQCTLDKLASNFNSYNGLHQPDWQLVEESQRDYAAEAAGY